MCGASDEQKELEHQQAAFYREAMEQSRIVFGQQQHLLGALESVYEPILAKGPNQRGFSDEERNELNGQVIEGTARNYASATKALNEKLATLGGGNIAMPSGGEVQMNAEMAAASAQHQSDMEAEVIKADYSQGYDLFKQATDALATASGQLAPVNYINAATNAGSAAATTANQITQADNSWVNAAIGAAGGIASSVVDMNPGGIFGPCWVAAELYGGWEEPRTQQVRAWMLRELPKTYEGKLILGFYRRHGQRWAAYIRTHRTARWLTGKLFDFMLRKAER